MATTVNVNYGRPLKLEVTRTKFEELTCDLLQRSLDLTRELLDTARTQKGVTKIDTVLLVGGSTRMPQVMGALKTEFGFDPRLYDPDEAVAKGAAIMGHKIRLGEMVTQTLVDKAGAQATLDTVSEPTRRAAELEVAALLGLPANKVSAVVNTRVSRVASHSLGVVCLDDNGQELVDSLIPIQTTLPATVTRSYGTVEDSQATILVRVMEGESKKPEDCIEKTNKPMSLPLGLPRGSRIDVTFAINQEGRLEGYIEEATTGQKTNFVIERTGVMSDEEVASAKSSLMKMTVS